MIARGCSDSRDLARNGRAFHNALSFRGGPKGRARNLYSQAVVMDSGLAPYGAPRHDGVYDGASELGLATVRPKLQTVIPGRRAAASSESIITGREYGFRARGL